MTTKETVKVFLRDGFTHRCEVVREQEIDRPFSDRTMRCRLGGREFECCVIRGAWSEWSDDNTDLSDPQLAALFDSIADAWPSGHRPGLDKVLLRRTAAAFRERGFYDRL